MMSNAVVSAQRPEAVRGQASQPAAIGMDRPAMGQRLSKVCFPVFMVVNILCFLGFCLAVVVDMERTRDD